MGTINGKSISFREADISNAVAHPDVFEAEKPQTVINTAGLKAVDESVEKALEYVDSIVSVAVTVFSSSATLYGNSALSLLVMRLQ